MPKPSDSLKLHDFTRAGIDQILKAARHRKLMTQFVNPIAGVGIHILGVLYGYSRIARKHSLGIINRHDCSASHNSSMPVDLAQFVGHVINAIFILTIAQ